MYPDLTALTDQSRDLSAKFRPEEEFPFTGDIATESHPPDPIFGIGKTDAFEGDGHFDDITPLIYFSLAHKYRIPAEVHVFVPTLFNTDTVHLDTEGIQKETEGSALFIKRVEKNDHPVILDTAVAVGHRSPYVFRIGIVTSKGDIEIFLIVADIDFGFFCGIGHLLGGKLMEICDLECLSLPDRIIQHTIDLRGFGEPGDIEGLF